MRRNLLYHIYPLRNPAWKWNVEHLNKYANVFNGRVLVTISTDARTTHFREVISAVRIPNAEFVVSPNDPNLGEEKTFIPALREFKSTNPDEMTFYAHAKGVSRYEDRCMWPCIQNWAESMYYLNLSSIPLIERAMKFYSSVGCFKRVAPHAGSSWHYSGTFFWFRHDAVFSKQWETIKQSYYGVEAWVGRILESKEGFSLFEKFKNLHVIPVLPEEYAQAFEMVDQHLKSKET